MNRTGMHATGTEPSPPTDFGLAGPHNDVEWRLALDMLRRGAWVVPVLAVVFGVARGLDAAGASLAGGAVVAGNFILSAFAVSRAARISIHIAAAAALFGFLLRLLLLGGVLFLLIEVAALDRIPVVVTAAVAYVVLLVLEAAALSRGAVTPGGRVLRRLPEMPKREA